MPVNVLQWRLEIGKFYNFSVKNLKVPKSSGLILFLAIKLSLKSTLNYLCYILNSITSHDFLKVKLLSAYNALQKFDIICISESYLNPDILSRDDNLNITFYDMVRADHPSGN